MTYNRKLSQLGEFVGINTSTNTVSFGSTGAESTEFINGIVVAPNGFVSTASTTAVKINIIGNKIQFSVAGIGSTSFNLV